MIFPLQAHLINNRIQIAIKNKSSIKARRNFYTLHILWIVLRTIKVDKTRRHVDAALCDLISHVESLDWPCLFHFDCNLCVAGVARRSNRNKVRLHGEHIKGGLWVVP